MQINGKQQVTHLAYFLSALW